MSTETMELTPTGVLQLFETTKEQRQSFVTELVERVQNGDVEPLKVQLQVKAMEDIVNLLTSTDEKKNKCAPLAKVYKNLLQQSAENYGAKSFEVYNAKFEIKEVGTKYDYSKCEDPVIAKLLAEQAAIDEKVKARQKMLQTLPTSGVAMIDEETGETFTAYPPAKSSTTSIAVTLK